MLRRVLFAFASLIFGLHSAAWADAAADRQTALNAAQTFAITRVTSLPQGSVLKVRQVDFDELGQGHVRLDHFYNDVPVFESEAIVHVDLASGRQLGVTDALKQFAPVSKIPSVSATQARQQANKHFNHTAPLRGRNDLMILIDNGVPYLSWRVHSEGADGRGPIDTIAFVNAHRGGVLRSWNNLHTDTATGTGYGFFYNSNAVSGIELKTDMTGVNAYALRDLTRGTQFTCDMNNQTGACTLFTNNNNIWGDGTLGIRSSIASDAQYGTSVTWDYYQNVLSRNGIAGDGKGAYNRVHYSSNYNNAFWSDSCLCMTYGDGDGVTFNPFDSLDVAGHEMSHGLTSRTAKLTYSGESGGLNEATSDIFGTMVEFYANNSKDTPDYLIGEKLYKSGNGFLRDMRNPSLDGRSTDCWYKSVRSLDVHYSSGVANHFFFLIAEGTTNGSPSKTCRSTDTRIAGGSGTVTKIGRDLAAKIWYRALTKYMTSSTNYSGARLATLQAAADIAPNDTTTYNAVAAAWTAVNVK